MNTLTESSLPRAAFIDPNGSNRKDVDQMVQQAVGLVLDFLGNASNTLPIPPWNGWLPQEILTEEGLPFTQLLQEVKKVLVRSMNPANPRFIGHMDTVPSVVGMLGEFISAAVNNNMLSVEMSPLLSRLESDSMREIATWFGFDRTAGGVMLSGGTLSNIQALAVARNDVLSCALARLTEQSARPVLFASVAAHTSIQKAAMLLGLGTDAVIPIDTDDRGSMHPAALQNAIRSSRAKGERPFCVVATAGTTTLGSIDPLVEIASICQEEALWFHVDAAYGGAVILSDRYRHLLNGIHNADSITFNPQKWLYLPKTCAALLFRDRIRWQKAFRIGAPYMESFDDLVNLGEVSLQGTRHADILKLWMSMRHLGRIGHASLIDNCMQLTSFFVKEIARRPYLTLAADPHLNLVCFRSITELNPDKQDRWNTLLQQHLNAQNIAFFSLPQFQGRRWLRAVLLNPHLNNDHITSIFEAIDTFKEEHFTS